MTETFGNAAIHWCARSARLLGWRPAEFWGATPAELVMALAAPEDAFAASPPDREIIARMMERDTDD